jgi:hypothetical protein
MPLPKIELFPFDSDEVGIVIVCNSGIVWTNQSGGTTCADPEVEGIFVPLFSSLREETLITLTDRWHAETKYVKQFLEAEELNDVLEPADKTVIGGEAWVPVLIRTNLDDVPCWAENLKPFAGSSGFLVYQNSD